MADSTITPTTSSTTTTDTTAAATATTTSSTTTTTTDTTAATTAASTTPIVPANTTSVSVATATPTSVIATEAIPVVIDPLTVTREQMRNMSPDEFKPIEAAQKAAVLAANPIPGDQDAAGIFVFLSDSTISDKEKIEKVSAYGALEFSSLVNKLISYQTNMGATAIRRDTKLCAGNNFDLLSALLGVISDSDIKSFTVKFMIVNIVFNMYRNDAYSSVMLHRFDTDWSFGTNRLKTFQILSTIIPELCNPVTRQAHIGKVNLSYVLVKTGTSFTDVNIKNIINFYTRPLPIFPASTTSTYVSPVIM